MLKCYVCSAFVKATNDFDDSSSIALELAKLVEEEMQQSIDDDDNDVDAFNQPEADNVPDAGDPKVEPPAKAESQLNESSQPPVVNQQTTGGEQVEPTRASASSDQAQTKKRILARNASSPQSVKSYRSCKSDKSTVSFQAATVPEFGQPASSHAEILENISITSLPEGSKSAAAGSSSSSVVKSIHDAMNWPTFHTNVIRDHMKTCGKSYKDLDGDSDSDADMEDAAPTGVTGSLGKEFKRMCSAFDSIPMSTAFSGIDAPGTGLCQQIAEMNSRLQHRPASERIGKPLHLNGVEWFQPSQKELLSHPCSPQCLYSDITMFLSPYMRSIFPELVKKNKLMDILKPLVVDPGNQSIRLNLN